MAVPHYSQQGPSGTALWLGGQCLADRVAQVAPTIVRFHVFEQVQVVPTGIEQVAYLVTEQVVTVDEIAGPGPMFVHLARSAPSRAAGKKGGIHNRRTWLGGNKGRRGRRREGRS
jgi:hypothetical protein